MTRYHAELKHPQGAHYELTAATPSDLARKISIPMENKKPLRDANVIASLGDEPDYLNWGDGWSAKVWKD
jgi:hypothetical protein